MLYAFVSNIYHYSLFIVNGEILLKNHETVTNLYAYTVHVRLIFKGEFHATSQYLVTIESTQIIEFA